MDLTLALTIITVLTLIAAYSVWLNTRITKQRNAALSREKNAIRIATATDALLKAQNRRVEEADRIIRLSNPAPVSRDELSTKFKGAAKKLINPARPQAQRSTDTPIIVADGGWSTPSSASCDTSPSSSSSSTDSGSCGGGE